MARQEKVSSKDGWMDGWMNPKDDRRRRKWKRKRAGQILNLQREKTRREYIKMLTERSKKRGIRSERVQSGESDTAGETDIQGGLPLYLAPPLAPQEADTSLHPFDRSQKGGWIEEWRGVKERDEWRRKRAKRGWAADGHLNARPPIYWKSGREGWSHTNMVKLFEQNAASHLLKWILVCTNCLQAFTDYAVLSDPKRKMEMLVRWASRPSSLGDIVVQNWPRRRIPRFLWPLLCTFLC